MGAVKMFTPYDLRPIIEITAFALTGVSTLVVMVRFYLRIWAVGRLKLYDYIMLAALLCTWGLCACNHYQLMFGSGAQDTPKPMPMISPEQIKALTKYLFFGSAASWYAYHIGYVAIMGLIKLSILAFYLSFATNRTFRILVHISIVAVVGASILLIFILAFQCPKNPLYALSPGILLDRGAGHCLDLRLIFYWQAGFNIGSDLFILALPLPLLVSLRMHTIKRLTLIAVFSVGLLVPIASSVRLWGVYLWSNSGELGRYYGGYLIFWSQVEINTAIICASAPSLQPMFACIFGQISRFQRSHGANYYYGGDLNSMAGPSVAEMIRTVPRDSITILEPPRQVYYPPCLRIQTEMEAGMIKRSPPEQDEIRQQTHAFSSQASLDSEPTSPSSICSTRMSPRPPSKILKGGWV